MQEPVPYMQFQLLHTERNSRARRGRLTTPHGTVETPAFMPVGTQGAVKGITSGELDLLGTEILLSNTYHLYLKPGAATIASLGGLHSFIGWRRPILTDSGGFQVYSLSDRVRLSEEGVEFRSHWDGSLHLLTPEKVIEIQNALNSDIAMVLDHCLPYPTSHQEAERAVERTRRWAERSRAIWSKTDRALFGIVQGSIYPDLRERSAKEVVEIGFEGYAIGGLSVGEPKEEVSKTLEVTSPLLPPSAPRYLMGMGTPLDIVRAVALGVDLFDCVLPTRNARNGYLFTWGGPLRIKNRAYANDREPIDPQCACYTCQHHSRSYLRHLYLAKEILSARLNSLHNLFFYQELMKKIREAIERDRIEALYKRIEKAYSEPLTGE